MPVFDFLTLKINCKNICFLYCLATIEWRTWKSRSVQPAKVYVPRQYMSYYSSIYTAQIAGGCFLSVCAQNCKKRWCEISLLLVNYPFTFAPCGNFFAISPFGIHVPASCTNIIEWDHIECVRRARCEDYMAPIHANPCVKDCTAYT